MISYKIITSIVICTLFINFSLSAKIDSLPIPELQVKEWIAKKWVVTDVEERKEKIKMSEYSGYGFFEFTDDGLIVLIEQGEKIFGKWKYKHNKSQLIILVKNEEIVFKIIELKENELVFEVIIDNENTRVFLKPM